MKGKNFVRDWMCKIVEVTHELKGFLSDGKPELGKFRDPVVGWVVGYTYRRRGETVWEGEEYGYVFQNYGPGELVFLIRPWPHEKTIDALPEHVSLTNKSPRPYGRFPRVWLEEANKFMSREMANWPRDEKGRWVKK